MYSHLPKYASTGRSEGSHLLQRLEDQNLAVGQTMHRPPQATLRPWAPLRPERYCDDRRRRRLKGNATNPTPRSIIAAAVVVVAMRVTLRHGALLWRPSP